ncbi:hypothetical protein PHLGIDRAFT_92699 [Phlebiopsis gigantea 11061_1 CR5-6]|uniref:GATA-type domain-containing protein n=1 Tax=Phlebiopsis gigantea (strain 11061_1 CR5-6) TaxID=745531 RepID=A0A0C3RV22_PHLG1|nr:hypothetical protein PHLGIDRAFT_92699 [Phlebiopsis gigantea 11061_1 CR5-6]
MSFFSSSHRPYDHLPASDFSRVPMNTLANYDNLSPGPMHPVLQGSVSHSSNHTPQLPDRPPAALPKVGGTRCYWALLSSDLRFVYLDPVLQSHLSEQADDLVGRPLLQFVHPDEQTSARNDLGGVLESRTLHGSVTRVRYSRLSRVRRMLGHQGRGHDWSDAEKIALDDNYMAVDIVINWAADGVVLCFIHAVVDISDRDNDEVHKTGWTNWCGTPYMSKQQVELLTNSLVQHIPQPHSLERVFQILSNEHDRPLLFSWPLARQQVQGGPTSMDFAKLAAEVNIGNTAHGTDAKTSCTRRYKAQQNMHFGTEGDREVESIFIPYGTLRQSLSLVPTNSETGSIIFACHKSSPYNAGKNGSYSPHANQQPQQYYHDTGYNLPPLQVPSPYHQHEYTPQQSPAPYSAQNWSAGSDDAAQSGYSQWSSQNTPIASSPSINGMRSSTYGPAQHPQQQQPQPQHHWSATPPSYVEQNGGYPFPPAGVHYNSVSPASTPVNSSTPAPAEDVVPASSRSTIRRASKESFTSGGRGAGNPPVGVQKCSSCNVTHSPEWRKGPSGKKDLCNACGLRYARSRAKKEGGTTRRRKDKVLSTMSIKSEHSPSTSPVNIPNGRRSSGYEDSSFMGTSASSTASSDTFLHNGHPELNGMKPSPSPTSLPPPFSSYPPAHELHANDHHRGSYPSHHYYTTLPSVDMPSGNQGTTLPRLDAGMSFPARVPLSMQSPPSPAPHMTAYDRSRSRDRGYNPIVLPPTPLAADGRVGHGKY